MKITFKDLKFKTDGGKLVPSLMHDFHPESYPEVSFKCEYLTNGETSKYYRANPKTGDMSFDLKAVFHDKVMSIAGLTVVDDDEKEIEVNDVVTFEKLPACPELTTMLNEVAIHLMNSATLTEEEEKNSDTDTSV
jgi:hypothetical protein